MLSVIESIYNMSIYGVNNYYLETYLSGAPQYPQYISPNIKSRIYEWKLELDGNAEFSQYYYAFTPNDYTYYPEPLSSIITRIDVLSFLPRGNEAFTIVNYINKVLATNYTFNATQWSHARFDDKSEYLVEWDAHNPFYDAEVRDFIPNAIRPYAMDALRNYTCMRYVNHCVGQPYSYPLFANFSDCKTFLEGIPEGTPGLETGNSLACRWWNSYLLKLRPEDYCEAVGPTGGTDCVDFSLASLDNPLSTDANRIIGPICFVDSIPQNIKPCV